MMQYSGVLIAVRDMERAKHFYEGLLGLEVTEDFGANVTMSDCISLQTLDTWVDFIEKNHRDVICGHNAGEFYFETKDMNALLKKLEDWPDLAYVHPLKEHSWGQRTVRFYDPDRNIIEVGEDMNAVVRRFLDSGMSEEETAVRMDVSLAYVQAHKN